MKLSNKLLLNIAQYYINRNLQDKRAWDKEGDLNKIFDCARLSGFSIGAVTGTFFLTRGNKSVVIDETTFPNCISKKAWSNRC